MQKSKHALRYTSVILTFLLVLSSVNAWAQPPDQSANSAPHVSQQTSSEQTVKDTEKPPLVLKSKADLDRLLASGPTVLDHLTPYGQRELLKSLRWNERGLTGFSFAAPLRELDRAQALAIYDLLDARQYFPKNFPTTPAFHLDDVNPKYERLLDQFKAVVRDEDARRTSSESSSSDFKWGDSLNFYRAQLAPLMKHQNLSRIGKSDLYVLFDIANEANFALNSASAMQDMKDVYRVFKRRGIDTRRSIDESMFRALLRHRDLKAAKQFIEEHEAFADRKLPVLLDRLGQHGDRQTVLVDQGDVWVRQSAPFARDRAQLVIVVSEGCGFCRKLMSDLERDKTLREHLERTGTVLLNTPVDGDPFEFVKDWNSKHAKLRMYVPNKISEWKGFDSGRVPQLLIVKNGKILHSSFGWQRDGSSKTDLLDQLAKFGL